MNLLIRSFYIIIGSIWIVLAQQQQQQQGQNAWTQQGSQNLIRSFSNTNQQQTNFNQNRQNHGGGNNLRQQQQQKNHGTSSSTNRNTNQAEQCNLNYQFDYFVLAIQWPKSFCLEKQQCNHTIARQHRWLIHGLWPNQYPQQAIGRNRRAVKLIDNRQQQQQQQRSGHDELNNLANTEYCCGPKYDQSIMHQGNLYNELLEKWPTLHPGSYHHGFWKHEWEKHGTCARNVRPLKNQRKYFETILGLYNRFNLSSTEFQNGQYYNLDDVHRNLRKYIGNHKIRIECSLIDDNLSIRQKRQQQNRNQDRNQNHRQISVFSEVHICLNKTLHPIDCIRRDDYQCKKNRNQILFP